MEALNEWETERRKNKQIMVGITDEEPVYELCEGLKRLISESTKAYNRIDIVCIGTDRSSGDSLGPMIGTFLNESGKLRGKCTIHGTLSENVNARNMEDTIASLNTKDSLVIAVDACLGNSEDVGKVSIQHGGLKPGLALGKQLGEVGDISIKGIINISGSFEFLVIQNTRLDTVYKMARVIEKAVTLVINEVYTSNKIADRLIACTNNEDEEDLF